jgi:hypothetical protein
MTRTPSRHSIAFIAVIATLASFSYGSTTARVVPAKGEKINFTKVYATDHLKSHPLQMVTKTSLMMKNTKGLLTATWNTTFRDIRTDEKVEASATGLCKAHGKRKVECTFDADTGTVNLTAHSGGVQISIPVGQGVQFTREKDGQLWSEILLGADEDNAEFSLESAKRI